MEWQPTTGFMTHVTCRLTAKNRDQLRNPMPSNRAWATVYTYSRGKGVLDVMTGSYYELSSFDPQVTSVRLITLALGYHYGLFSDMPVSSAS